MSVCENCGRKNPINNQCKCSSSSIEKPISVDSKVELTFSGSKKSIVKTSLEQFTFQNRNGVSIRPSGVSPFTLNAINDEEIKHWAEKTINWFYAKQTEYRLSLEGLIYFAENSIVNKYSAEAHRKLIRATPILETFVHKTIMSI